MLNKLHDGKLNWHWIHKDGFHFMGEMFKVDLSLSHSLAHWVWWSTLLTKELNALLLPINNIFHWNFNCIFLLRFFIRLNFNVRQNNISRTKVSNLWLGNIFTKASGSILFFSLSFFFLLLLLHFLFFVSVHRRHSISSEKCMHKWGSSNSTFMCMIWNRNRNEKLNIEKKIYEKNRDANRRECEQKTANALTHTAHQGKWARTA